MYLQVHHVEVELNFKEKTWFSDLFDLCFSKEASIKPTITIIISGET
jgi:hypothetical protein